MLNTTQCIWILAAYLIGAIPFGLLIGLARGVDIRQQGSKNIGATNTGRVLGKKWGYLCLALDLLKGLVPVVAASQWLVPQASTAGAMTVWLAVGLAAILGHVFPVYLGFRGGKGVATTIGVGAGIFPYFTVAIVAALIAYAAVRYGTGYVSLGSIALAVTFPVAVWAYAAFVAKLSNETIVPLVVVAAAIGAIILLRHRENISRLLAGTENRAR